MQVKLSNKQSQKSQRKLHSLQELSILLESSGPGQPMPAITPWRFSGTYHLVSLMMYLIGVEEYHFKDHTPDLTDKFKQYQADQSARIIRNLCMIRTALQKNCKEISFDFHYNVKTLASIPEYVDSAIVQQLYQDGVNLHRSKPEVDEYLLMINQEISNRINTIQHLFPEWIKWDYIKELFLMPNGFKPEGIRSARVYYNEDRNRFPYQCYINWNDENVGNLLYTDEKFARLLYDSHNDYFENRSLVRAAGNQLLDDLYYFIGQSKKTLMVVDCENSDPIKLAAALSSLSKSQHRLIQKIILFDSDYTSAAWQVLRQSGVTEEFTMEHVVVKRLNEHKSQLDMTLASYTCREVYVNGVDSVILVSSDSDYWALIQSLPGIHFLTMLERKKTGQHIIDALEQNNYHYCYIDDFCTNASYTIKTNALIGELQSRLDEMVHFNIRNMMDDVIYSSFLGMTAKEKELFYDRYLKKLQLKVDADGEARIFIE